MISLRHASQNPLIRSLLYPELDTGRSYGTWRGGVSDGGGTGGRPPSAPSGDCTEGRPLRAGTPDRRAAENAGLSGGMRVAAGRFHRDGVEHTAVPHRARSVARREHGCRIASGFAASVHGRHRELSGGAVSGGEGDAEQQSIDAHRVPPDCWYDRTLRVVRRAKLPNGCTRHVRAL